MSAQRLHSAELLGDLGSNELLGSEWLPRLDCATMIPSTAPSTQCATACGMGLAKRLCGAGCQRG